MNVHTILDFLANIGGFVSIVFWFGAVIVDFLAKELFIASLMKILTAVNLLRSKTEILKERKIS